MSLIFFSCFIEKGAVSLPQYRSVEQSTAVQLLNIEHHPLVMEVLIPVERLRAFPPLSQEKQG